MAALIRMARVPAVMAGAYVAAHAALSAAGLAQPFELFNLLLLVGACGVGAMAAIGAAEPFAAAGAILLMACHGLVGQRLAPDALTSGAILLANLLVFHVGVKIHDHSGPRRFAAYVAGYFALYAIFILALDNAEPLFILALLGLAATGRSFRLTAYFWAMTASFTLCQPYSWECAAFSLLALKALFSARDGGADGLHTAFLAAGGAAALLILAPIAAVCLAEDPRSLLNILKIESARQAILASVMTATLSTAILALACIPFAYALARTEFWGKSLLLSLADLPIVIPQTAAGIAILQLLGSRQYLGEAFFDLFGTRIDGTLAGVCAAQLFVAFPFMLKGALAAFSAVPPTLEQCARTLGAPPLGVFLRVSLPLASRGVALAAVLAWARAAGEFGAVFIVAPDPETAPVAVYNRFETLGLAEAAPLVSVLVILSAAAFLLSQWAIRQLPELHRARE